MVQINKLFDLKVIKYTQKPNVRIKSYIIVRFLLIYRVYFVMLNPANKKCVIGCKQAGMKSPIKLNQNRMTSYISSENMAQKFLPCTVKSRTMREGESLYCIMINCCCLFSLGLFIFSHHMRETNRLFLVIEGMIIVVK